MLHKHASQGGSRKWRRITVPVPPDLSDRIDAAVHGQPGETLTSLVLRAAEIEIDRLEAERGSGGIALPFPAAPGRPPPGRPRKIDGNGAERDPAVSESSAEVERLLHVLEQASPDEVLAKSDDA